MSYRKCVKFSGPYFIFIDFIVFFWLLSSNGPDEQATPIRNNHFDWNKLYYNAFLYQSCEYLRVSWSRFHWTPFSPSSAFLCFHALSYESWCAISRMPFISKVPQTIPSFKIIQCTVVSAYYSICLHARVSVSVYITWQYKINLQKYYGALRAHGGESEQTSEKKSDATVDDGLCNEKEIE